MRSLVMRSLVLLAVVLAGGYYYHQQHPAFARRAFTFSPLTAAPAAPAATSVLHYHSPLDAGNTRGSSGYYSTEPAERYETTGPKSTASGRAAVAEALAQAQEAKSRTKSPAPPDEP